MIIKFIIHQKLKLIKNYEVTKLDSVIEKIIENKGNNKKVYTEKDFQVNGKNPKIIINKTISTAMMENFVNSDEEIVVTGFYENNEGIKYKPFNFSFSVNKDEVKKIYFKDGAIYIWDN